MVSGINFNNYSVEQLKELKNAGVQGISDKDIKAAEEREAAKASDEANSEYQVTEEGEETGKASVKSDAGKVNEAKVGVEAAEASGASLKGILQMLMEKCNTQNSEMAELTKSIDQFKTNIQLICAANDETVAEATEASDKAEAKVDAAKAEADAKQAELAETEAKIEAKQAEVADAQTKVDNGTATEEDVTKVKTAQGEITSLQDAAETIAATVKDKVADMKEAVAENKNEIKMWNQKVSVNAKQAEIIADKLSDFVGKAQDANEYADVTIEKGTEASNIDSKKEAKNAGFTKRVIFWKKGDVKAAHAMGNAAIATGASLGNASKGVAGLSQEIAVNCGIAEDSSSTMSNLAAKEYADTSKFDGIQVNSFKTARAKQGEANAVAEQQKKLGKKEAVPADASTQAAK